MKQHASRTPQSRQRASERARAYWADPAIRAAHGAKTRIRMAKPEVRIKISERTKAARADREIDARYRAAIADPENAARHRAAVRQALEDPAMRQKISERTRAGIAAKLDRQFADLIQVWSKMPEKVRQRFFEHVLAGWERQQDDGLKEQGTAAVAAC